MLKKCNAVCSWVIIICLFGHLFTMSYSMLTGWYDYSVCKMLAWFTAAAAALHVLISLIIVFFFHDGSQLTRYPRRSKRIILQRASGIVIICLLHLHVKAFGFIVNGTALSASDKCFILITELLFFAAIFVHLGVSFSRSLITMGWLASDRAEKKADFAMMVLCAALMLITGFALTRYIVLWTGFGG